MDQVRKATVFSGKRLEKIMLAVDAEPFRPIERNAARRRLKLPPDRKIVFCGAQFPRLKKKGMAYLLEALNILAGQGYLEKNRVAIAVAGNPAEIKSLFEDSFPYESLGYLSGEENLAAAYQAADLFVCPSIEDSGPMMINEAIQCGTPVVSFDMGVAPDLVITGQTGYCAELKNSSDLAEGIKSVLDLSPEESRKMSETCRRLGMELCHPTAQAESFKSLFDSLLDTKP
jgi:glycosyltransferase involved in cell wall biosynthesis